MGGTLSKPLIIVESPAKADTIKRYLHGDYDVIASAGHIKDLPVKSLGVDVEKDFKPSLSIVPSKRKIVDRLKKAAAGAESVLLAPDPDREGEAIAWHIAQVLTKINTNVKRILFNEVTPAGVRAALESPRQLSKKMYESQLARRILDRLVGYQISPILWRKVQRGLSAGRVQSVAVRLIVEREREIEAFDPREFWVITAVLDAAEKATETAFRAKLLRVGGKKAEIDDGDSAHALMDRLRKTRFRVAAVTRKDQRQGPKPPFITSTLQQEASRLLRFSPSHTMAVAQRLYEGVDQGDQGRTGLITYMRTDSFRLSKDAVSAAREEIAGRFGPEYLPPRSIVYRNKKKAQDAHEAIRPTSASRRPEEAERFLKRDEFRLYRLIYNRFMACQMAAAVYDKTIVDVEADDTEFRAIGSVLKFKGHLAINVSSGSAGNGNSGKGDEIPPGLAEGQWLTLLDLAGEQKFTQPPPRFSEASLVRELEERGIGRPSTYASIVKTIQEKGYSDKKEGRLRPSELGRIVSDLLVEHFSNIVDYDFTARMEEDLDQVEEGRKGRLDVLNAFYGDFEKAVKRASDEMRSVKAMAVPSGIECATCGKEMLVRFGKNGSFLGCSGYPDCKNTQQFERDDKGRVVAQKVVEVGSCPECDSPLVVKSGRFGRFVSCSAFPKCRFTQPFMLPERCPMEGCGGHLVEKRSRKGRRFFACGKYPDCKFSTSYVPFDGKCPDCGAPVLFKKKRGSSSSLVCLREGCGHKSSDVEAVADGRGS